MRNWWGRHAEIIAIMVIGLVLGVAVVGGCSWFIAVSPKNCHVVYVQTTPVDGKPALERVSVCDGR